MKIAKLELFKVPLMELCEIIQKFKRMDSAKGLIT